MKTVHFESNEKLIYRVVCAHVSFLDPSCDPSLPPRRSVEVRAVVINQRTK